jgi:hypothetical protein
MINIAELINDPDFVQNYTVYRKDATWSEGETTQTETKLKFTGVVVAANTRDVNMLPEGDRIAGLMVFYTTTDKPFYPTRSTGTSDEILWRGDRYKLMQVYPYDDYGYVKAIGTRKTGD